MNETVENIQPYLGQLFSDISVGLNSPECSMAPLALAQDTDELGLIQYKDTGNTGS